LNGAPLLVGLPFLFLQPGRRSDPLRFPVWRVLLLGDAEGLEGALR